MVEQSRPFESASFEWRVLSGGVEAGFAQRELPGSSVGFEYAVGESTPAVRVVEGQLQIDTERMIKGLAYPVEIDGKKQWVTTPDRDLIQIFEQR